MDEISEEFAVMYGVLCDFFWRDHADIPHDVIEPFLHTSDVCRAKAVALLDRLEREGYKIVQA